MKKWMVQALVITILSAGTTAHAQLRKIPAEVTEAFKEKYPAAKNAEWKDKLSYFQVGYQVGDSSYVARFSSKGEWQQTEKEITEDALPAAVKDGYGKSKYTTDWELKSVTRIESSSNGIQYRLFVRKSGVEKKYLYFDTDGKLIKDTITL